MRYFLIYILFSLFFIFSLIVDAHVITIENGQDHLYVKKGISLFIDTTLNGESPSVIIENYQKGFFKETKAIIPTIWMNKDNLWLHISLINNNDEQLLLEINNITIDEMQCFVAHHNEVFDLHETGWQVSIKDRSLKTARNAFALPLKKHLPYEVFIRVKRTQGTLKAPVEIWTMSAFNKSSNYKYMYYGFFTGVILLVSMIALSIFFNTRDIKFLYYGLYSITILTWRLIIEGFAWEYLNGISHFLSNPIHGGAISAVSIYFFLAFLKSFLLSKKNYPIWYSKMIEYVQIAVILFLIAFILSGENTLTYPFMGWIYYSILFAIVTSASICIVHGVKQKDRNAIIYLISVSPILIVIVIVSLTNLSVLNSDFIWYDVLLIPVLFEIIVLCIGLALELKKIVDEKRQLLITVNEQQKEAFAIQNKLQREELKRIEAQYQLKNEKERISRDLHDSIGSELSNIIYNIDFVKYELRNSQTNTLEKIDNLSNTARNTMDQLRSAIWVLNQEHVNVSLFTARLYNYLNKRISNTYVINYEIKVEGDTDSYILQATHALYLYRIMQEAINNTLKYAQAKNITITISKNEQHLLVTISDDGIGFDLNIAMNQESYGLKNISKRIADLKGQCTIISTPTKGTLIHIELPIINRID